MKTRSQTPYQKLQILVALALSALLLNYAATAQDRQPNLVSFAPEVTAAGAPAFQAAVFPSNEPLVLKVVFRNPAREPLTLVVKNDLREIIYRQQLGRVTNYNNRYSLADLADGDYRLEIAGTSVRYVKSLRVGTQVTRVAETR